MTNIIWHIKTLNIMCQCQPEKHTVGAHVEIYQKELTSMLLVGKDENLNPTR